MQFLTDEVEELRGRVGRRDAALTQGDLEEEKLRGEVEELRGEVDELRGRVGWRNARLQEQECEVGALQLLVQEQDAEVGDLSKRLQEQDLELAELRRAATRRGESTRARSGESIRTWLASHEAQVALLREQNEAHIQQLELQMDVLHSTLDAETESTHSIPASAGEEEGTGGWMEVEAESRRAKAEWLRAHDDDDEQTRRARDDDSSEEERDPWGRRL